MPQKRKILLVDDDLDFLEMHKAVLMNHGYEVTTATSAQEGWEKVRAEMPDLIVLDLMMEEHDAGFSFAQRIKNDPLFKKTPILMVTAVADATGYKFSLEEDGYWMKTDAFLDKPVEPSALVDSVKKLLDQKED
jgi:CheY-like chemotaxis protein